MKIRRMRSSDLPQVEEIDGTAFTELISRLRNRKISLASHERKYFELWMENNPAGSLVAEENETIVGFNFCHAGPRMGWIGPLAVKPGQQGKGIGRKLMLAGMKYFDRVGTSTVGLDTFPENPVSVSLYLSMGFRIVGGLCLLTRNIPARGTKPPAVRMTAHDVRRIAALDRNTSGFNREKDYRFILSAGLGCGLTLKGAHDQFAFAMIRRGNGLISNFHLTERAGLANRVETIVEGAFQFFREKGIRSTGVLCRGNDSQLLKALFDMGFEMNPVMITMHRGKTFTPTPLTSPLAIEKG